MGSRTRTTGTPFPVGGAGCRISFGLRSTALVLPASVAAFPDGSLVDLTYFSLSCALLVGALLTVRVRPGAPGSSLLIIPLIAAWWRLGGLAVLPALAVVCVVAAAVRVRRPIVDLTAVVLPMVSFALAAPIGTVVGQLAGGAE